VRIDEPLTPGQPGRARWGNQREPYEPRPLRYRILVRAGRDTPKRAKRGLRKAVLPQKILVGIIAKPYPSTPPDLFARSFVFEDDRRPFGCFVEGSVFESRA